MAPPPATNGSEPQLIKAAAANGGAHPPSDASVPATGLPLASRPPQPDEQPKEQKAPTEAAAAGGDETRLHAANGFAGNPAAGNPTDSNPTDSRFRGPATPIPAAPLSPRQPAPHSAGALGTAPGNGDARPRLHLSLGAAPSGSGGAPPTEGQAAEQRHIADVHQARPPVATERGAQPANREASESHLASEAAAHHSSGPAGHYGATRPGNGDGAERRAGGGSFIDKELRARVDSDIAAFLAAFDAALGQDTQESRSLLREATDRLLRAGARTRIELERLEARVPLAPRDGGARRYEPAWRDR
jgi:hypothetical protein